MSEWLIDTNDRQFETDVLERSRTVPVVVDFWAPWCAPCRTLGPLLERLAQEYGGGFVVAKVNVDENPGLAQAFAVSSIPMVLGLRGGEVVGEFVGAQPEAEVRAFIARLLPSPAEQLAQEATAQYAAGRLDDAEAILQRALEADPECEPALTGMATVLADRRQFERALELLERVPPGTRWRQEADRIAAAIRITQAGGGDEAALRGRLAAAPGDLQARFTLAQVLAAGSRYEEALAEYLDIVSRDRSFRDDAARKAMLDIYELLGADSEIVARSRSALAKVLFR
ncbi:MAG: tetratricopeptide repeat protein [Deltaproteobacteria bacterium]|nr:tetratricopeptide repeat protein [Deltaproteobacteria bacterium]